MKNKNLLLLTLLLVTSCDTPNTSSDSLSEIVNLSIICPSGAPALAFYNHFDSENFETNATPLNIVASMTEKGSDIVVIDTIKGVQTINEGAPYKLAANITFGNFYIVSTGNDDNNTLDSTDEIVIFGKNQTPDRVFQLLYGTDFSINYVSAASDAAKCIISGKTTDLSKEVDYVLAAQPAITSALKKNTNASIYQNIQELYTEKTGASLIQAGLFVKNTLSNKEINTFLSSLEDDIADLLDNPELIINKTSSMDSQILSNILGGLDLNLAKATISNNNSIGLGFKYAIDNKDNIDSFLSLFNLTLENEKIYQK